jgi:hypothetical protein
MFPSAESAKEETMKHRKKVDTKKVCHKWAEVCGGGLIVLIIGGSILTLIVLATIEAFKECPVETGIGLGIIAFLAILFTVPPRIYCWWKNRGL